MGDRRLAGRRPGPKGPSKLTEAKRVEIGALRAEGLTLIAVAQRAGVSIDTVRRALARASAPVRVAPPAADPGEPQSAADRTDPRDTGDSCGPLGAARRQALVVLPALAATGLLDAVPQVYDREGAGRSGLHALASMVLACLLEGRSDPGASRVDPMDISRLLGFDGAVETEPRCWWMRELAAPGRTASLVDTLARRCIDRRLDVEGILDVAGVVSRVPAGHGARWERAGPRPVVDRDRPGHPGVRSPPRRGPVVEPATRRGWARQAHARSQARSAMSSGRTPVPPCGSIGWAGLRSCSPSSQRRASRS